MKWCCSAFKSWYEGAGERGFAVLVGRDSSSKPQFVIQHRSVDFGTEDSVKTETPLSLVADVQIDYCPWCGRRLDKWYEDSVDVLYRSDLKVTYS
jgi:hypothetical protein